MRLSKWAVIVASCHATLRRAAGRNSRAFKRLPILAIAISLPATIFLPATVCGIQLPRPSRAALAAPPWAAFPAAQTAGSAFRPLDLWTEAVQAGDQIGLKRFYLSDPRAFAQIPSGKTSDIANEESSFWSSLRAHGLVSINSKILQQTEPQSGQMQLVLRIEMSFRANSNAPDQKTLVSASQLWIRQGNDWKIAITQRSDVVAMPVITLPQPTVPNTHLYPEPSAARAELDAATALAKSDHKRVLVVFGANWCYDCHVLDATLRSKGVAPLIAANYHIVHINIGDGDSNEDLANRFAVPLKKGIPSLAVLDGDGKLITSQKQGEFESAAKIGMSDVLGFLNRWKPPSKN